MELNGKVALVTGASSGMGKSTAKILASAGVRLALVGRNEDRLNGVVDDIHKANGDAKAFFVDLRFGSQVDKLVDDVVSAFGRIDILVNSAFWGPPGSIE